MGQREDIGRRALIRLFAVASGVSYSAGFWVELAEKKLSIIPVLVVERNKAQISEFKLEFSGIITSDGILT